MSGEEQSWDRPKLQKMIDALAEKAAFPPVLASQRPFALDPEGVTYFPEDFNGQMPVEWTSAGRYDVGGDR